MRTLRAQRGVALLTVLGILGLFLLVALLLMVMTSQNSTNFGNAYQKQRYYDVAEAGIDRGLRDLDTAIPSPGATGFLSATPAPPPPPPGTDQTPLPNVPNVPYHYSYWYNPSASAVSTPDPLIAIGAFGVSSGHLVNVPANGAVIWSYTTTGLRDVAAEAVVDRFGFSTRTCALCAGQTVSVTGSNRALSPPPIICGSTSNPYKVCSDPKSSPSPAPTSVPIIAGGTYQCSGSEPSPCTITPTAIQTSAPPTVTSGFLASQGTIDALANAAEWQLLSTTSSNIKYLNCTSACGYSTLFTSGPPTTGQVTFINGNVSLSSGTPLSYGGTYIISGCLDISQPGMAGTSLAATVIVLGTDTQCAGVTSTGNAISIQGGGNTRPPLWDVGTAYAAQGSISIAGNGSIRGYNFYGAAIAAGNVTVSGNGYFAWESATINQASNFGPFAIDSFAQY